MDTYFAPAERSSEAFLINEISIIEKNPVVDGLLHSISGLLAVLNDKRQILAINDSFLKQLDISDPKAVLGLRPGEAVQCIHSDDEPGGCGTSKYCSTCGAAIAIVTSLEKHVSVEKLCALTVGTGTHTDDKALLVRTHHIQIKGSSFLLLFLQDVTLQEKRAALERTFFHDINNMLCGLIGHVDLLEWEQCESEHIGRMRQITHRLQKEVEIQRCLMKSEMGPYHVSFSDVSVRYLYEELLAFYVGHPVAEGKRIEIDSKNTDYVLTTDSSLVLRILCNMTTNALEASEQDEVVKIKTECSTDYLDLVVWNSGVILDDVARRIFQRNYSTKKGSGRGLGTYSMKLFGEEILGGKVSFSSSVNEGTEFKLSLRLQNQ